MTEDGGQRTPRLNFLGEPYSTPVLSSGATLVKYAALSFGIERGTAGQASPEKTSKPFGQFKFKLICT